MPPDDAASRGLPSAVWRFGQDRRFDIVAGQLPGPGGVAVDVGCGLGLYTARLAEAGMVALGLEVEWPRAREARAGGVPVAVAAAEALPFADGTVDFVLSHEVLEHVADDRAAAGEVARVLAPGGRAVVFVPNRLWPFETHGVVWRGRYRFGNAPLVNYLPDPWRNRLAPHVRVYTAGALRALFRGLPVDVIEHRWVFPGYDKLAARRPRLGRLLRRLTYRLERTPAARLGLSHVLVAARRAEGDPPGAGRGAA